VTLSGKSEARRAKRLSWIALFAGVMCLALVIMECLSGAPTPWTWWALTILLITNAVVFLLPHSLRVRRVQKIVYRLTTFASILVLVTILLQIWYR